MYDKVKHAGKLKLRQKKYTASAKKQTLQIAKGAKSFYNCNNYVKLLAYTKYYFKKCHSKKKHTQVTVLASSFLLMLSDLIQKVFKSSK